MHVRQLDVRTAFLNGVLDDVTVYMQQPEGFVSDPDLVCHLTKAIYGLKQAPRQWHKEVKKVLCALGFAPSFADPGLFVRTEADGSLTYVLTYVDDFLVATKDLSVYQEVFAACKNAGWELKELGFPEQFLSINIENVGGFDPPTQIILHQGGAIDRILSEYNMAQCKSVKVPITDDFSEQVEFSPPLAADVPFSRLVGMLLYLSSCTRPDLAYVVHVLTRVMSKPQEAHWELAKRVLKYLKGTCTLGISYSKASNLPLACYSDSCFSGNRNGGRSISGYAAISGGGAVSWHSRKQSTVSKSSSDAEYQALSAAVTEVCWLRALRFDMGLPTVTVPLYGDNVSSLSWGKEAKADQKNKHISTIHHHIREKVERREIELKWISGSEMVADMFTKPLGAQLFLPFRDKLGMVEAAYH